MTFKGQPGIGIAHPHPVVDNLDQGAAGILQDNLDMGCSGIDRVLHQFLDDTGGTLDDFAGSNLIGYRVGQEFDNVTHGWLRCLLGLLMYCYRQRHSLWEQTWLRRQMRRYRCGGA